MPDGDFIPPKTDVLISEEFVPPDTDIVINELRPEQTGYEAGQQIARRAGQRFPTAKETVLYPEQPAGMEGPEDIVSPTQQKKAELDFYEEKPKIATGSEERIKFLLQKEHDFLKSTGLYEEEYEPMEKLARKEYERPPEKLTFEEGEKRRQEKILYPAKPDITKTLNYPATEPVGEMGYTFGLKPKKPETLKEDLNNYYIERGIQELEPEQISVYENVKKYNEAKTESERNLALQEIKKIDPTWRQLPQMRDLVYREKLQKLYNQSLFNYMDLKEDYEREGGREFIRDEESGRVRDMYENSKIELGAYQNAFLLQKDIPIKEKGFINRSMELMGVGLEKAGESLMKSGQIITDRDIKFKTAEILQKSGIELTQEQYDRIDPTVMENIADMGGSLMGDMPYFMLWGAITQGAGTALGVSKYANRLMALGKEAKSRGNYISAGWNSVRGHLIKGAISDAIPMVAVTKEPEMAGAGYGFYTAHQLMGGIGKRLTGRWGKILSLPLSLALKGTTGVMGSQLARGVEFSASALLSDKEYQDLLNEAGWGSLSEGGKQVLTEFVVFGMIGTMPRGVKELGKMREKIQRLKEELTLKGMPEQDFNVIGEAMKNIEGNQKNIKETFDLVDKVGMMPKIVPPATEAMEIPMSVYELDEALHADKPIEQIKFNVAVNDLVKTIDGFEKRGTSEDLVQANELHKLFDNLTTYEQKHYGTKTPIEDKVAVSDLTEREKAESIRRFREQEQAKTTRREKLIASKPTESLKFNDWRGKPVMKEGKLGFIEKDESDNWRIKFTDGTEIIVPRDKEIVKENVSPIREDIRFEEDNIVIIGDKKWVFKESIKDLSGNTVAVKAEEGGKEINIPIKETAIEISTGVHEQRVAKIISKDKAKEEELISAIEAEKRGMSETEKEGHYKKQLMDVMGISEVEADKRIEEAKRIKEVAPAITPREATEEETRTQKILGKPIVPKPAEPVVPPPPVVPEAVPEAKPKEKKSLTDIRKEKYLEGKTEALDKLISEGWKPIAKDIKDKSAITKIEKEINNLKQTAPIGNEQHPDTKLLRELQQQIKDGVTKKSYRLEKDDNIKEITKIEYDYLVSKEKGATEKPKSILTQEADLKGMAEKEVIPEIIPKVISKEEKPPTTESEVEEPKISEEEKRIQEMIGKERELLQDKGEVPKGELFPKELAPEKILLTEEKVMEKKPLSKEELLIKLKQAKEEAKQVRAGLAIDPYAQTKREVEIDRKIFDTYVDLVKIHIKEGVKNVTEFVKSIGEKLNETIKLAWETAETHFKVDSLKEKIKEIRKKRDIKIEKMEEVAKGKKEFILKARKEITDFLGSPEVKSTMRKDPYLGKIVADLLEKEVKIHTPETLEKFMENLEKAIKDVHLRKIRSDVKEEKKKARALFKKGEYTNISGLIRQFLALDEMNMSKEGLSEYHGLLKQITEKGVQKIDVPKIEDFKEKIIPEIEDRIKAKTEEKAKENPDVEESEKSTDEILTNIGDKMKEAGEIMDLTKLTELAGRERLIKTLEGKIKKLYTERKIDADKVSELVAQINTIKKTFLPVMEKLKNETNGDIATLSENFKLEDFDPSQQAFLKELKLLKPEEINLLGYKDVLKFYTIYQNIINGYIPKETFGLYSKIKARKVYHEHLEKAFEKYLNGFPETSKSMVISFMKTLVSKPGEILESTDIVKNLSALQKADWDEVFESGDAFYFIMNEFVTKPTNIMEMKLSETTDRVVKAASGLKEESFIKISLALQQLQEEARGKNYDVFKKVSELKENSIKNKKRLAREKKVHKGLIAADKIKKIGESTMLDGNWVLDDLKGKEKEFYQLMRDIYDNDLVHKQRFANETVRGQNFVEVNAPYEAVRNNEEAKDIYEENDKFMEMAKKMIDENVLSFESGRGKSRVSVAGDKYVLYNAQINLLRTIREVYLDYYITPKLRELAPLLQIFIESMRETKYSNIPLDFKNAIKETVVGYHTSPPQNWLTKIDDYVSNVVKYSVLFKAQRPFAEAPANLIKVAGYENPLMAGKIVFDRTKDIQAYFLGNYAENRNNYLEVMKFFGSGVPTRTNRFEYEVPLHHKQQLIGAKQADIWIGAGDRFSIEKQWLSVFHDEFSKLTKGEEEFDIVDFNKNKDWWIENYKDEMEYAATRAEKSTDITHQASSFIARPTRMFFSGDVGKRESIYDAMGQIIRKKMWFMLSYNAGENARARLEMRNIVWGTNKGRLKALRIGSSLLASNLAYYSIMTTLGNGLLAAGWWGVGGLQDLFGDNGDEAKERAEQTWRAVKDLATGDFWMKGILSNVYSLMIGQYANIVKFPASLALSYIDKNIKDPRWKEMLKEIGMETAYIRKFDTQAPFIEAVKQIPVWSNVLEQGEVVIKDIKDITNDKEQLAWDVAHLATTGTMAFAVPPFDNNLNRLLKERIEKMTFFGKMYYDYIKRVGYYERIYKDINEQAKKEGAKSILDYLNRKDNKELANEYRWFLNNQANINKFNLIVKEANEVDNKLVFDEKVEPILRKNMVAITEAEKTHKPVVLFPETQKAYEEIKQHVRKLGGEVKELKEEYLPESGETTGERFKERKLEKRSFQKR